MPDTAQDYQQLLSHALQKQIVILGKQIALAKARHVEGLKVTDEGQVTAITQDPKQVVTQFLQEFRELSSPLVKKTMQQLLQISLETPASTLEPEISDPLAIKPLPSIMRQAPETPTAEEHTQPAPPETEAHAQPPQETHAAPEQTTPAQKEETHTL